YSDWSINNIIVFNANDCGHTCEQGLLYIINPDKTGLKQIGKGAWTNWSPDGNQIVYDRCGNIYVANADGSNEKQLTTDGKSIYPCWSPDGTKIAYFKTDDEDIWVMNADGSNKRAVTNGSFPDAQPDWGIINAKTSVAERPASSMSTPEGFILQQNYPNPFQLRSSASMSRTGEGTEISYYLNKTDYVTLKVFNLIGQEIASLVSVYQGLGQHSVFWNGRDQQGQEVPAGIYLYKLRVGQFSITRKMMVVY
ncbi:MAG: DPP IV N-terminal domain-containing protein, partial [bacterium]